MSTELHFQAVVIGAGPGGYVAAIRLAQLGVQTAIIERKNLGGVCLNVGCIPSKALIEASKRVAFLNDDAAQMGIQTSGTTVDFPTMQTWKQSIVGKLTAGVGGLLKGNGVTILEGDARLEAPGQLAVKLHDGSRATVSADHIVLATGSRPIEIPGFPFDSDHVLSSTGALALPKIPKRLVVIGGGYIGLEMGGVYARLGSKVTVVEMASQILPGMAKDLVQPVSRALIKRGAEVLTDARAKGFSRSRGVSKVEIELKDGSTRELTTDAILVTVGRRPNTERLGLESVGVTPDDRGFIPVDEQRRTTAPGVYAIGDIVEGPMLAHKASKEGDVVAEVIAGLPSAMDVAAIPAVVFSEPEIATVGLSEAEARSAGYAPVTGKFPFSANGRALTTGKSEGFTRVIRDSESDLVLGVEIVGPGASDLIAEATLALEMTANAEDIGATVHAHPTLAEVIMEASHASRGHSVHTMPK